MRLIDANALTIDLLKKAMDDALIKGNADTHRLLVQVIAHYPTVDAVPIDWLVCKRNEHNNDGFAWIFEAVIDDWRRENAAD